MPLEGGRYRVVTKGGEKIRLHFTDGGDVDEAKNMKTGKVHTPAEFAADKKSAGRRLALGRMK